MLPALRKQSGSVSHQRNLVTMGKFTTNCIYIIGCVINSKVYIGRTINPHTRRYRHFNALREGRHYNKFLQSDFDQYGESAFQFEIVESCVADLRIRERESYWIDFCNSFENGYNQNRGDMPRAIVAEVVPYLIPANSHPSNHGWVADRVLNRELEAGILDWPNSE